MSSPSIYSMSAACACAYLTKVENFRHYRSKLRFAKLRPVYPTPTGGWACRSQRSRSQRGGTSEPTDSIYFIHDSGFEVGNSIF